MLRAKFYKLITESTLDLFYESMIKNQISRSADFGYEVIDIEKNRIHAKFIEKVENKSIIENPFGDDEIITTINYRIIEFLLLECFDFKILVTINAPLSEKAFIKSIINISKHHIFIDKIKLDPSEIRNIFVKEFNATSEKVLYIKASKIVIDENSSCSIEVKSKENALESAYQLLKNTEFSLDKIKIELSNSEISFLATLSKSGLIEITERYLERVIEIIIKLIKSNPYVAI